MLKPMTLLPAAIPEISVKPETAGVCATGERLCTLSVTKLLTEVVNLGIKLVS